jgi:hypothetical protein
MDVDISSKHSIIDNENKLSYSLVDYSGSNLAYIDISTPLQAQLTTINNSISTLTGLQAGDVSTFQDIQDNFDLVDTQLNTKQNVIVANNRLDASLIGDGSLNNVKFGYLANIDADIQTQINNLTTADNAIHSISYTTGETTIAEKTILTTLEFSGDNSQQTTAFTDAKNTELTNATSNITQLSNDVNSTVYETGLNTAAIATKQNILNNTDNKLTIDKVDLTGSSLINVDISNPLQAQLTTINTNINNLQIYDTSQTNLNTTLTNSINNLETDKQNIIDVDNKVPSLYISYNGLSTVRDELNNLHSYNTTNDTSIINLQNSTTSLTTSLTTAVNNTLPLSGGVMTGIMYNLGVAEQTVLSNHVSNVFTLDIRNGNMFYCTTNPTANFTINLIGLSNVAGVISNAITTFSLIHSSNFYCSSINVIDINNAILMSASIPKYPDGNLPSLSGTKTYIQTFSFLRCLPTKIVISNVTAFA